MAKRITVGVLFGGRSAEHEVSLRSARTVVEALDPQKYSVILIGIDREGRWFLGDESRQLLNASAVSEAEVEELSSPSVALTPNGSNQSLMNVSTGNTVSKLDVLFPVLHGPYGEDGTVQGLAKLANVACVGAGVLGSAIGMDKDVMKRLLRDAGLPIGKFLVFTSANKKAIEYQNVRSELGEVVFVKPANLGSSVGISKATTELEFLAAVELAFTYDRKIIIEENISGREIELSVLGNDELKVSVPGEIKAHDDYYSYDAKYSSSSKSESVIPADLPDEAIKEVQELAAKAFTVLECRGLARVDFFYTPAGKFIVNEINTIPGFTSISMYPKLWEASGLPLPQLVDSLIELAQESFAEESARQAIPT